MIEELITHSLNTEKSRHIEIMTGWGPPKEGYPSPIIYTLYSKAFADFKLKKRSGRISKTLLFS